MPSPFYTRTNWVNDASPDIDATNLNKIENGIEDAHERIDPMASQVSQASSNAASANATVQNHVGNTNNPHNVTIRQVGGRHHKNAAHRGAVGNDSTDNTAILQALLDELHQAGGGELYIPGPGIYRTRTLYVPGNTRVVTDGAKIRCTGLTSDIRRWSGDGDPIGAPGVFTVIGWGGPWGNVGQDRVLIEGFEILTTSPNPFGLYLAGDDIVVRDCWVRGNFYECWYVTDRGKWGEVPQRITIERVEATGGQRNGAAIVAGRYIHVRDSLFFNSGTSPVVSSLATPGEYPPNWVPACGLDIETFGSRCSHIWIEGNSFIDTHGAGLGLIFGNNTTVDDGGQVFVNRNIFRGCSRGQYAVPGGAGTKGCIQFNYGDPGTAIIVTNNIQGEGNGFGYPFAWIPGGTHFDIGIFNNAIINGIQDDGGGSGARYGFASNF